ncbi:DEAD/DEAH box helicase, partial [uncultured Duncaniella sp.]
QDRQTLMFSATMPPKIQQLAKAILNDPAEVKIAVSRPTEKIAQSACVVYENQKPQVLKHLFRTISDKRVIVFASSKLKVKDLAKSLRKDGWKVGEMHSDLEQERRDEVMLDFRAARLDIIVATDILARGIDIDDISLVVNYDVPREAEDYVHRIGRTARAGAGGAAVTLVSESEQGKFGELEQFLGYTVEKRELPEKIGETPEYNPNRRNRGGRGKQGSRSRTQGRKYNSGGKNNRSPRSAEKPEQNEAKRPATKVTKSKAHKAAQEHITKAKADNARQSSATEDKPEKRRKYPNKRKKRPMSDTATPAES